MYVQKGVGSSPAWSPDGEKIAYMAYGAGGIYGANADGSNPQFVTATAIDADENTSEFSRCVEAQPGSYLTSNAGIGSTTLQVNGTQGFLMGDLVRINPGGANQEDHLVLGFGSLLLDSPLLYDHTTGEPVIVISERIYLPAIIR